MVTNVPREQGFTLLEALVALVIVSAVLASTWQWFDTATRSTQRIEAALTRASTLEHVLIRMESETLKSQRRGTFELADADVQWQATLVRRSDNEIFRRQPAWTVALFELDVVVERDGDAPHRWSTHVVRQWPNTNVTGSTALFGTAP